jgi:two-component SAPR family response regulator
LINPDIDLWFDTYEFETLVQQARLLSPRTAHAEALWRRAVDLYRGDFLPASDWEWAFAHREALRETYLEALVGLATSAYTRGDFQEAIVTFKRALQIDPFREDIHRTILTCYAEQGEQNQVLKHFNQLKESFQKELAVEPSHETLSLAEALLG